MTSTPYRPCFERVPAGHPLSRKRSYQRRAGQRDLLCARMCSQPVTEGWRGFIVEGNTSLVFAVERPQLVLGTVEECLRVRLRHGQRQEEGSRALQAYRE